MAKLQQHCYNKILQYEKLSATPSVKQDVELPAPFLAQEFQRRQTCVNSCTTTVTCELSYLVVKLHLLLQEDDLVLLRPPLAEQLAALRGDAAPIRRLRLLQPTLDLAPTLLLLQLKYKMTSGWWYGARWRSNVRRAEILVISDLISLFRK